MTLKCTEPLAISSGHVTRNSSVAPINGAKGLGKMVCSVVSRDGKRSNLQLHLLYSTYRGFFFSGTLENGGSCPQNLFFLNGDKYVILVARLRKDK